jgi:hypothetical protein
VGMIHAQKIPSKCKNTGFNYGGYNRILEESEYLKAH